jgi:hypothetical protein
VPFIVHERFAPVLVVTNSLPPSIKRPTFSLPPSSPTKHIQYPPDPRSFVREMAALRQRTSSIAASHPPPPNPKSPPPRPHRHDRHSHHKAHNEYRIRKYFQQPLPQTSFIFVMDVCFINERNLDDFRR